MTADQPQPADRTVASVEPPLSVRRHFRFGLRALLAAITLVALLLGWAAWRLEQARQQERSLAELRAAAGVDFVGFDMPASSPEWLKTIPVFESNFFD